MDWRYYTSEGVKHMRTIRKERDMAAARAENLVGERIARARREKGLSLESLSVRLEKYGLSISYKGLSKWERGETVPNAYQLMAVCQALGIRDLLEAEPELNAAGRRKLADYRDDLIASGRYAPVPVRPEPVYVDMPVYYLPVSAGTGTFLDGEACEMIGFPADSVPSGAEFGLRVSGDSMEPVYHDGQIVWVQACDTLRVGEVGIFTCGGEGYIKAYAEREPEDAEAFADAYGRVRRQPVLISYNRKYAPRPVSPEETFRIVGRVLR